MVQHLAYEPPLILNRLQENTRKLFFLWEYLASEGLQDEAREYLLEHEDDDIPFETVF